MQTFFASHRCNWAKEERNILMKLLKNYKDWALFKSLLSMRKHEKTFCYWKKIGRNIKIDSLAYLIVIKVKEENIFLIETLDKRTEIYSSLYFLWYCFSLLSFQMIFLNKRLYFQMKKALKKYWNLLKFISHLVVLSIKLFFHLSFHMIFLNKTPYLKKKNFETNKFC
jgi:hypothetical protein